MFIYKAGSRVSQEVYGPGTVLESNEHHTVIDFDDDEIRRFVTRLVVLSKTAQPAPEKPANRKRRTKR